jgi:hypothetical protein
MANPPRTHTTKVKGDPISSLVLLPVTWKPGTRVAVVDLTALPPAGWRVGRKVGRTIYNDDDILIGVMDTPELAQLVVDALNLFADLSNVRYGGGDR